jgi:thymidylate synthase (FAD)
MRYVDLSKSIKYFVTPRTVLEKDELAALFDDVMAKCKSAYDILRKKGIPPEDSRFVLPIATQTKIVVTMNARELRHFFEMRCCLRAQWEVRQLANEMLRICRTAATSSGSRGCGIAARSATPSIKWARTSTGITATGAGEN